jgi:hypothetical protein
MKFIFNLYQKSRIPVNAPTIIKEIAAIYNIYYDDEVDNNVSKRTKRSNKTNKRSK